MNDEYSIVKAFQRIEETLILSLKRNLKRHLNDEVLEDMNWSAWQLEQLKSLEQFKKENKKIFQDDFSNINTELEKIIKSNYNNGMLNQEKQILDAIKKGFFEFKSNQSEATFFQINERKLNALIEETTSNVKNAETSILRYTDDQYRKIIYDAQVYANTGASTLKQVIDMATHDFLAKGINNIQYANGRMVNIASYVEMAIRTANKRAYLQGEGTKRQEWGVHTVLVPNRGGGCPYCIKFQGRVFIDDVWSGGTGVESKETGYPLLSTAIKEKLFHPNCKDGLVTHFPGINTEPTTPTREELEIKKQNYLKQQKLNYIDKNIDKFRRLELGSIDEQNVQKYHNKMLKWEEYKKQFKMNHQTTFSDIIENEKIRQQEFIRSKVIGNIINKVEIRDVSKHLIDRVRQREIELDDIVNTLKNPLECGKIKYNKDNKPSFAVIGENCTLYVNPNTGNITTIHKTHTKLKNKLKGENNEVNR